MLSKVYTSRVWILLFMLLPFVGNAQIPGLPDGWAFTLNPTSQTLAINATDVTFTDVAALEVGDWVGAFYDDEGVLKCGGAVQWTGSNVAIVVFGNDTLAGFKNGFWAGEAIQWKFYRTATSTEEGDIMSTPDFSWTNGGLDEILGFYVEDPGCEQAFSFTAGWNWISFNVLPEATDLNTVLGIDGYAAGDFFQTVGGTAEFYDGFGWFGTLTEIDPDKMYQLNLASNKELLVVGECVDVADPIALAAGWNWIGYKPQNQSDINVALATLTNVAGDFIQTVGGTAEYYDGFGWFGTLAELFPGKGYQINLTNAGELIYPEVDVVTSSASNGNSTGLSVHKMNRDNPGWPTPPVFPNYQLVYYQVLLNGVAVEVEGSQLSAWKDGGIRGLQSLLMPPPIPGALPHYPLQMGSELTNDPGFTFKFYHAGTDMVYDIVETHDFEALINQGSIFAPVQLNCIVSETIDICGTVTDVETTEPIEGATVTATTGGGGGVPGNPNWPTPAVFPNYQLVYYQVVKDGEPIETAGSQLSAWKSDDDIRGLQSLLMPPPIPGALPHYPLQMGSELTNDPGFTFKFYDAEADMVYDIVETHDFVALSNQGSIFAPVVLTVVTGGAGETYTATTDVDGNYCMTDVVAGTYTIGAEADGYEAAEVVDVAVEASVTQDFALVPDCPPAPIVFAGNDIEVCADVLEITLGEATVENGGDLMWYTTNGLGVFDDEFALAPTYFASPLDVLQGSVELCLSAANEVPGCDGAVDCLTLTFLPLPEVTLMAFEPMCAGSDAFDLFGGMPTGGMYYVDGVEMASFDPAVAGEFEVEYMYTDENGCSNSAMGMIVVNALPEVTLMAYEPLCAGSEAFDLYGGLPEGGMYYVDGVEMASFDPAVAGEFEVEYMYTDENGCSNSAMGMILVNALPEVSLMAYEPICAGSEAFDLYGGMPEGGMYYVDGVEMVSFDPAVAGEFEVEYMITDENGCSNSAMGMIVVNALPEVTCPGDMSFLPEELPYVLMGGMPEGGEYTGEGVVDGVFDVEELGDYVITYTVTDENGCDNYCMFTITVTDEECEDAVINSFPEFQEDVCAGTELVIDFTGVEILNAESYEYIVTEGAGEWGDGVFFLDPAYVGMVTITLNAYAEEPCMDATASLSFNVNPLPYLMLELSAYEICLGEEVMGTISGPVDGAYPYTVVYTLNGEEMTDVIEGTPLELPLVPEMAGTYTLEVVSVVDANGCAADAVEGVELLVHALPTLEYSYSSLEICLGETIDVTVTGSEDGAYPYTVDYTVNGMEMTDIIEDEYLEYPFTPEMAMDYEFVIVSITDMNGCVSMPNDVFNVAVHALPVAECPEYEAVCEGSEAFEFPVVEMGVYTDADDMVVTGFDPVMAGTYMFYLTVTNEFGCSDMCEFSVVVNPLPYLMLELSADVICLGEEVMGTISGPENGFYPYTVVYTINGEEMTDVIEGTPLELPLVPEMAGTYTLEVLSVVDANGCMAMEVEGVELVVLPLTEITAQPMSLEVLWGEAAEFMVEAVNATGYQWYFEGMMIDGATEASYSIAVAGDEHAGEYYCMVDGDCGAVMSDVVTLTVNPWTQVIDFLGPINGMSTYLDLIDKNLASIVAPVAANISVVDFRNPDVIWTPANTSFDINEAKGAKVVLTAGFPTSIEVQGYPTLGTEVNLLAGSNYIPVWSQSTVLADDVFGPLGTDLYAVFSLDYSGYWWPAYGLYTLEYLEVGSSYLVVMNNAAVANFDVPAVDASPSYVDLPRNITTWQDATLTGTQHNIAITSDALSQLQVGDVIGAFNEYGQLAGMVEIDDLRSNTVLRTYGDNPMTAKAEGFQAGDLMTIKVWRNGEEMIAQATFADDAPNQNVFAKDGASAITNLKVGATSINDLTADLNANLYPNPATDLVNIQTNFEIENLKVVNYVGQVVFDQNVNQSNFQINTSNYGSGMYFVQISTTDGVVITKRLTVK